MRFRSFFALLPCLVAGALACGDAAPETARAPTASATSIQDSSSLVLRLEMPSQVRMGEAVDFRLVLTNLAADSLRFLAHPPPWTFDVVIRSGDGTIVWSRFPGQDVPSIGQEYTLAPRDSLVFTERWAPRSLNGGPVGAGDYMVSASFFVQPQDGGSTSHLVPSAGPLRLRVAR